MTERLVLLLNETRTQVLNDLAKGGTIGGTGNEVKNTARCVGFIEGLDLVLEAQLHDPIEEPKDDEQV